MINALALFGLLLLATLLVVCIRSAIVHGEYGGGSFNGEPIRRETSPILFWFCIGMWGLLGVVMVLVAIWLLMGAPAEPFAN